MIEGKCLVERLKVVDNYRQTLSALDKELGERLEKDKDVPGVKELIDWLSSYTHPQLDIAAVQKKLIEDTATRNDLLKVAIT